MIKFVKHEELDFKKYDFCVHNSINSRVYALSTYLNIVADNWGALVLDDYAAVMPLPWRSKFLIKYIYPPCWTQQLGVFSNQEITGELVNEFLKSIPVKFLKTSIQFNSQCKLPIFTVKHNYTLSLNNSYDFLHRNYRKDRKDRLKKFKKSGFVLRADNNIDDLILLFKNSYTYSNNLNIEDYNKLGTLSKHKSLNPIVLKIYNNDNELISGSIFFKDHHRIYYLFSANNNEGNKIQGNTAIIDHIIHQYAETNYTLDFEGSMVPGIASFFKSFGSTVEDYYFLTKKRI